MKYRDLFELENALKTGMSSTKYWTLLKPLTKISSKIRKKTDGVREILEPTEAIKVFTKELNHLRAKLSGEDDEKIKAEIKTLTANHQQAQFEAVERNELEREMLDDDVEIKLEGIPESYFHADDELRISVDLFMLLDRLGLVIRDDKEDAKPALTAVEGEKK